MYEVAVVEGIFSTLCVSAGTWSDHLPRQGPRWVPRGRVWTTERSTWPSYTEHVTFLYLLWKL